MTEADVRKLLTSSGFRELRKCRHGVMWTDGTTLILAPIGGRKNERSPSAERNFIADVKRAVRRRTQS